MSYCHGTNDFVVRKTDVRSTSLQSIRRAPFATRRSHFTLYPLPFTLLQRSDHLSHCLPLRRAFERANAIVLVVQK
jgi:hypothetical protein